MQASRLLPPRAVETKKKPSPDIAENRM